MANIVGKRYVCRVCGSEFIVTKAGAGCLTCHGQPVEMKEPTQPPASQGKWKGAR